MGELVRGPWPDDTAADLPACQPDCPHETPGGTQRCALCREAALAQHRGYLSPHGRITRRETTVQKQSRPMPPEVRQAWAQLNAPRPEQGRLL